MSGYEVLQRCEIIRGSLSDGRTPSTFHYLIISRIQEFLLASLYTLIFRIVSWPPSFSCSGVFPGPFIIKFWSFSWTPHSHISKSFSWPPFILISRSFSGPPSNWFRTRAPPPWLLETGKLSRSVSPYIAVKIWK